jgi:hypothetical protein
MQFNSKGMLMASTKISQKLVDAFIDNERQLRALKKDNEELKTKLRTQYGEGKEHPLLRFVPSKPFKPNWKLLTDELTSKFLTQAAKRVFYRKLHTRFPAKEIAPTIKILTPEFQSKRSSEEEEE